MVVFSSEERRKARREDRTFEWKSRRMEDGGWREDMESTEPQRLSPTMIAAIRTPTTPDCADNNRFELRLT